MLQEDRIETVLLRPRMVSCSGATPACSASLHSWKDGQVIYYLSLSLLSPTGGSRAGADALRSLVAPRWHTTVVCKHRIDLPREVDGQAVPETRWLVPPSLPEESTTLAGRVHALCERMYHARRETARLRLLEGALDAQPAALVIHNGFPEKGAITTRILECAPKKLIIVHSTPEAVDYFQRAGSALTREWVGDHLRDADALMFVSPQLRDDWAGEAEFGSKPSFVIPNTCRETDAEEANSLGRYRLRQLLGLPEDAFIVCCVGRVEPNKGQDLLLAALPDLARRLPALHVVFVGGITPLCESLVDQAKAMGLGDRVLFAGARQNPYSYICASDLLVHPSRTEGQGMVILEAMVLNTPIVATCVGGIPSMIEHGVSGWLIPREDVHALTHAIETLAQSPALREHLAQAAATRYWQHFSSLRHRAQIQSMVASCLAR